MITAITEVWLSLTEYLVDLFPNITALFYVADTGLTFVGILAVIMAGISIALLVFNLIRSFLPMRG